MSKFLGALTNRAFATAASIFRINELNDNSCVWHPNPSFALLPLPISFTHISIQYPPTRHGNSVQIGARCCINLSIFDYHFNLNLFERRWRFKTKPSFAGVVDNRVSKEWNCSFINSTAAAEDDFHFPLSVGAASLWSSFSAIDYILVHLPLLVLCPGNWVDPISKSNWLNQLRVHRKRRTDRMVTQWTRTWFMWAYK